MARDLLSNRLFSQSLLPSVWGDDDEMFTSVSHGSGLSVSEDEKNVYVEAHVPGIDPSEVDITFHEGTVWIRGEAKKEEQNKARKYYRQASSSFSYRVTVPSDVDPNVEPEATYNNGIMTVTFAKSPKSQPKKIAVKTAK